MQLRPFFFFFFFNDTATTEIYTLSLHDALPICVLAVPVVGGIVVGLMARYGHAGIRDRKSTRLNSSHLVISYAVFCLKKKKKKTTRKLYSTKRRSATHTCAYPSVDCAYRSVRRA